MSKKRQEHFPDSGARRRACITTLTRDYAPGHLIPPHSHRRDQLVYASRGVMTVRTKAGEWVVPTNRAVLIPAGVRHDITMCGAVAMRTLYLVAGLARGLPRTCCVVTVSPLLKELILRACEYRGLSARVRRQRHLIDLILDQMETVRTVPLRLPNPTDPRALRVARALLERPAEVRPLGRICTIAGASKRTIERLFQRDLGMSVGKWRQQLRLLKAMQLLAQGAKVTHAALEAGYSTPSAFISMFRKTLGSTPAAYFRRPA
ncbi:MAG TPA: helix-turn-helix transcriptional regulator [Steroidobacteraceae bacterium]|nr:helix-turn-helix transcriptional regulator [Steroidobacteraceae bacterium]